MQAARDLELLVAAAQSAGEIAQRYFKGSNQVWEKPDGAGPVSEADLAVDTHLRELLTSERRDYGWLSEETEDTDARQKTESVFVVDPIDGTRSFLSGADTWAHSLAVVKSGQVTAAAVYLPARNKLYAASKGGGAFLNEARLNPDRNSGFAGSSILAARPTMDAEHWPKGVPEIHRSHRPSLAYRLCLVAEGRFDAMLTFRKSWEWDIAAGTLILTEAGAKTSDRMGNELAFNNPHPQTEGVIASGHEMHAEILGALGRKL